MADILAGPPTGPNLGFRDIAGAKRRDVAMQGHLWPMPLQNCLAMRVYFAVKYRSHPGALESEVEAPNPGEEGGKPHVYRPRGKAMEILRETGGAFTAPELARNGIAMEFHCSIFGT